MLSKTAVVLTLVAFNFYSVSRVSAHSYTLATVAAGMAAAEAQFTDLKYHYNLTGENGSPDNPNSRLYSDTNFATKQPESYLFYDIRSASSNDGVRPKKAQSDIITACDGVSTIVINRSRDGWNRFTGEIVPGFSEQLFNGLENPQQVIWGMGGFHSKWNKILSENAGEFVVSDQFEKIEGIDTVKLSGPEAKGSEVKISLWIAPSKGFLPLKLLVDYPNGLSATRNLSNLSEVKSHMWLPLTISEHTKGELSNNLTITSDHVDLSPLTASDFRPKFPPGSHITDKVSKMIIDTPPASTQPIGTTGIEEKLLSYLGKANAAARLGTKTTMP